MVKGTRSRPSIGPQETRTRKGEKEQRIYQEVMGQDWNVFGQQILHRIREQRISLAQVVQSVGIHLHLDSFYNLVQCKYQADSRELEVIFRLAQVLDLDEVMVLVWYQASNKKYYSANWRGVYHRQEFDALSLAGLTASFSTLWETLIHSPGFRALSPQEKSERVIQATTLLMNFFFMDELGRETLLETSKRLVPAAPRVKIDPKDRVKQHQHP